MDFEDPIIKRISQVALSVLMMLLLIVAGLTAWVVADWDGDINRSETLVKAINILPSLTGERTGDVQNIVGILFASLPLMVAPVCFTTINNKQRLNKFGGVMACVMLAALLLAGTGYMGIDLTWQAGHELGLDGLTRAQQWARAVLSASVFYIAALLGVKGKS